MIRNYASHIKIACKDQDINMIKIFVDIFGLECLISMHNNEMSGLHYICKYISNIDFLFTFDNDIIEHIINLQDENGYTPLHILLLNDNQKIIDMIAPMNIDNYYYKKYNMHDVNNRKKYIKLLPICILASKRNYDNIYKLLENIEIDDSISYIFTKASSLLICEYVNLYLPIYSYNDECNVNNNNHDTDTIFGITHIIVNDVCNDNNNHDNDNIFELIKEMFSHINFNKLIMENDKDIHEIYIFTMRNILSVPLEKKMKLFENIYTLLSINIDINSILRADTQYGYRIYYYIMLYIYKYNNKKFNREIFIAHLTSMLNNVEYIKSLKDLNNIDNEVSNGNILRRLIKINNDDLCDIFLNNFTFDKSVYIYVIKGIIKDNYNINCEYAENEHKKCIYDLSTINDNIECKCVDSNIIAKIKRHINNN
jgi:hypothetical protein